LAWCWTDVFRGGGLGERWVDALAFVLSLVGVVVAASVAWTVELEDEFDEISATVGRPSGCSVSFEMLPPLERETGGRVEAESPGLVLEPGGGTRIGRTNPGDCDVMDVGVVSRL
jgi:hypothetical protein